METSKLKIGDKVKIICADQHNMGQFAEVIEVTLSDDPLIQFDFYTAKLLTGFFIGETHIFTRGSLEKVEAP
jgi:hypothetical protein